MGPWVGKHKYPMKLILNNYMQPLTFIIPYSNKPGPVNKN